MMDMEGRRYVVFGVANHSSICWPIAELLQACGGEVVLASLPRSQKVVDKLAAHAHMPQPLYCDVTDAAQFEAVFKSLESDRRPIHGIVHGIAKSDAKELRGRFVDTSEANFEETMRISCWSLIKIVKRVENLLADKASILTLTFEAGEVYYPYYHVMALAKAALHAAVRALAVDFGERAIRVNAIAASPEMTTSARGVKDYNEIGLVAQALSPEGRRATLEEIANVAAFLLSEASSGVTGAIFPVDCGLHMMKMAHPRNAHYMQEASRRQIESMAKE